MLEVRSFLAAERNRRVWLFCPTMLGPLADKSVDAALAWKGAANHACGNNHGSFKGAEVALLRE